MAAMFFAVSRMSSLLVRVSTLTLPRSDKRELSLVLSNVVKSEALA